MEDEISRLKDLAKQIRLTALRMTYMAPSAHVGSSLSMADLLAVLYGAVMRVSPLKPKDEQRDRFVMSKGHACAGLYAVLATLGYFPKSWLDTFYKDGGRLFGHVTTNVPGVEVSTGSLGHGLPIAVGMALAAKQDGKEHRIFALLSDGECQEGSTWEAILFAAQHQLDNLVVVVDYNKGQGFGYVKDILNLEPFPHKWEHFNWSVKSVDGHNIPQLLAVFAKIPFATGRPSCVIAHTIKGKGVSFMEDQLLWHYRNASREEYERAVFELEQG